MAYTLFYMVGKSDVQINQMPVKQEYWQVCQQLKKLVLKSKPADVDYDVLNGRIRFLQTQEIHIQDDTIPVASVDFPIFAALTKKLKPSPDQYLIIATQQKSRQHRQSDTWQAAELLAILLKKTHPQTMVEMVKIDKNPSDYDLMADFFAEFTRSHRKALTNSLQNYYCLSSGTPAMILSFSLAVLPYNLIYHYVPNDKRHTAKVIRQFDEFRKKQYAQQIDILIGSFHYATALQIIGESPFRNDDVLVQIVSALDARQRFAWSETIKISRQIEPSAQKYFSWISHLQNQDIGYYLLEMLARIELAISQKDLQVTLAWLFNILENCRNLLLQKYIGIEIKPVKKDKKNTFPAWEKYINTSGLFADNEKDDLLFFGPSRTNVLKVLKRKLLLMNQDVTISEKDKTNLKAVIDFLKKVESNINLEDGSNKSLQQLRNEGPFAHGIHGIEQGLFEQIWPGSGVHGFLHELKDFVSRLTPIPYKENPFQKLNTIIKTHLH